MGPPAPKIPKRGGGTVQQHAARLAPWGWRAPLKAASPADDDENRQPSLRPRRPRTAQSITSEADSLCANSSPLRPPCIAREWADVEQGPPPSRRRRGRAGAAAPSPAFSGCARPSERPRSGPATRSVTPALRSRTPQLPPSGVGCGGAWFDEVPPCALLPNPTPRSLARDLAILADATMAEFAHHSVPIARTPTMPDVSRKKGPEAPASAPRSCATRSPAMRSPAPPPRTPSKQIQPRPRVPGKAHDQRRRPKSEKVVAFDGKGQTEERTSSNESNEGVRSSQCRDRAVNSVLFSMRDTMSRGPRDKADQCAEEPRKEDESVSDVSFKLHLFALQHYLPPVTVTSAYAIFKDLVQQVKPKLRDMSEILQQGRINSEQLEQAIRDMTGAGNVDELPRSWLHPCISRTREGSADDTDIDFPSFATWLSRHSFSENLLITPEEQECRVIARKHGLRLSDCDRYRQAFNSFDKDASGFVDFDEFRQLLPLLMKLPAQVQLPVKRVRSLWAECSNDEGLLTFDDFLGFYLSHFGEGKEASPIETFYSQLLPLKCMRPCSAS